MSEAGGYPGGEPDKQMGAETIGALGTAGTPQTPRAMPSAPVGHQSPYGYGGGPSQGTFQGAYQYQQPYATQQPRRFQQPAQPAQPQQPQPSQPYMLQHPYTMPRQQAERTDTGASGNGKTRRITITTVMLACAIACGIVQPAFIYEGMSAWHSDIGMFWSLIGLAAGAALPFLLRSRDEKPEFVCLITAIVTICLPISPLTALMAQSALIARRDPDRRIYGLIALSSAATIIDSSRIGAT